MSGAKKGRKADHPLFKTWYSMKSRCHVATSDRFAYYGGRGIQVCERWRLSFDDFVADVGSPPSSAHTLDRIDNSKGYEPGNVRWATRKEQALNRRSNRMVTANGETMTISQWAERLGVPWSVIGVRLGSGWMPEHAVTVPQGGKNPAPRTRPPKPLSDTSLEVLRFIVAYRKRTEESPSFEEIAAAANIAVSSAFKAVKRLVVHGLLVKTGERSRNYRPATEEEK